MLKRFTAFLLALVFGIRGGIKPPLGGPSAGRLYPFRLWLWRKLSALYSWSGLPERWQAWRLAEAERAARDIDPNLCCCGCDLGQGGDICGHGGCRSARDYVISCHLKNDES